MTTPVAAQPVDDPLVALHRRHYRDLVHLASLLLDEIGECEEVVQDAFARLARRGLTVDPGHEAAYLRSMVLNAARSRLRRRQRRRAWPRAVTPPVEPAEETALRQVETTRVLAALRELPRRQAEVLALRYQAGLSESEIAATLGISAGSVKTHAHRGLTALRQRFVPDPGDPR
ncbi:MAG: sigma-70 family RNA polymerase sigma factor [Actinomyces sp.]|nr:MAG: sigma-70 family RNA polymerase sigma factor [Actinomyces sp.]